MLKALELVGFKSFADKTRLEFPRGITVIVGPNGSGKSNIVDAIKWVLGEQSVKSLRGKEMADVIFNGATNRRALNSAETTLTFDNSSRLLAIDTPEVQITRRVYRSGEGEYLINRQPARLRDIRDLFAGTGMSTEAYSVIEQGKVDILLQASPRDRRLIFEEAAGISRFKAKKIEAQRRLERVEQNLLRLSDIVDEVDNRLRSVRTQAAKARRYKEYADRLQELRTQVGRADWRALSTRLQALEVDRDQMGAEVAGANAEAEAVEARALALEVEIAAADAHIRDREARLAQNRERIAAHEATIEHQRRHSRDLDEEVSRDRRQLAAMSLRAGNLEDQLSQTNESLSAVEVSHRDLARRSAEEERSLTHLTAEWDALRGQNEQRRAAHLEQLRRAAGLGNQISALESRMTAAEAVCQRGGRRRSELLAGRQALWAELEQGRSRLLEQAAQAQEREQALQAVREQLTVRRQQHAVAQAELAGWRERHSGASERAAVLEEVERRLEGVSAGVKEVLVKSRSDAGGPYRQIRGLVADLLHVHIETAPLIEAALGEMAQHVVVAGSRELVDHLQQESTRVAGRVGFVRLDVLPAQTGVENVSLEGQPGVLGRADRFVETAPEFAVLAKRMLGKTWIVSKLADALTLAESVGRGLNFVTRAGELLTADGTLVVGPRQAASGLISRRSELRALKQQIVELTAKIQRGRAETSALVEQVAADDRLVNRLGAELRQLRDRLAEQRLIHGAADERFMQLDKQLAALEAELVAAVAEQQAAQQALANAQREREQTEAAVVDLESRLHEGLTRATELEGVRQRAGRETNAARVAMAKSEQQLESLRTQKAQLERDQQERARALTDSRSHLQLCRQRAQQAERNILAAESLVAELYLRKESLAADTVSQLSRRREGLEQKSELTQEAQRLRARSRKLETRLHAKELSAGEVRHERTTLADRLREDYGIELAALEHALTPEELDQRDAVEAEIADLRAKINSIGGVNLEALGELEELEARYASLASQHHDLSSAKGSLEQIINKINADSRRLFAETLELVREHFQTLFRKLFGGGQADIVLEEGVDVLDSGIEIVARPPGKEPRNISLLSGGEKTLTCVALLLAIFRSRPSPFCVLDEVDAALDEANIERFIGVLHEFLAWTQFIVVTHSKKTMTCASTLYGVTMQESGISKRVSVRFEDVTETGEFTGYEDVATEPSKPADDETQAA